MKRWTILLFAVWVATGAARASLRTARQAEALLGPGVWSRVVEIANANPRSVYPRTVYACVFEFNGLLWFYSDTDGTQSFSRHTNRLAEERADFAPLLRDIEPGFVRFRVLPPPARKPAQRVVPPNACFIESVVALREMLASDTTITDAALLAYYVDERDTRRGHTVLLFERSGGDTYVVDAQRGRWRIAKPPAVLNDALAWARAVEAPDAARVAAAKWVPVGEHLAPEFAQLERKRMEQEVKAGRVRIAADRR